MEVRKVKKINKSGFTLIELLVVVAIIAILALIVLLALNPVEMARRSRDSRRLSDMGTIRRAIDLALTDKQALTPAGPMVINPTTNVTDFDGNGLDISKYISVIPQDPINDGSADSVQAIAAGCTTGTTPKNTMVYEYASDGDTYVIRARLESTDNCNVISEDGNLDDYYELGTDPGLNLIP
jgi:prepilin-type N-terminal cleavage/methylation domain-containing protein